MNIDFDNTAIAYEYKQTKELLLSKKIYKVLRTPMLNKFGSWFILKALQFNLPINKLIKSTIYSQFVGGETFEETVKIAEKLFQFKVSSLLDYGIEGGSLDNNFTEIVEKFISIIKFASTKPFYPYICVKLSGLAPNKLLEDLNDSPRLRSGIHDNEIEEQKWTIVKERMLKIIDVAYTNNIGVLIDAEESWIQDPIDRLAIEMMEIFNHDKAVVFNTYQLYRKDRLDFLKLNHRIAQNKNFILGAKLVRGAYMEKEKNRAKLKNYPSPIHHDKEDTDKDYNLALEYALQNEDNISVNVATHNEESCLKAVELIEKNKLNKTSVLFSQLYGMSDNISFNLAHGGYQVAKYMPFGNIKEVIPYLMRRAQENSAISAQSQRELELIIRELNMRRK